MRGWLQSAGIEAQASRFSPETSAFGDTGDAAVLGSSSGRSDLSSLSSQRAMCVCSWRCDSSGGKGLHLHEGGAKCDTDRLDVNFGHA